MADSIDEALPELRGAAYAQVREWDVARVRLARDYEAADGEYLAKIHAALKVHSGLLWAAYLAIRGLSYQEATARIRLARAAAHRVDEGEMAETPNGTPGGSAASQAPVLNQLVYTAKEACELLKIGPNRMSRLLLSGDLPSAKIGSHTRRITRQALLDYLARQEAESQPERWQA